MSLDETIMALSDPTRRELIRRLALQPRRAGELAEGFSISRPGICKHTRLLLRAGLIRARKSGRERIYELAPNGGRAVKVVIGQLEAISRSWDTVLDTFKQFAEAKR
jgi:DNA-binding transcriptional ArsR family regulator